jgi:competence protein ComFC
MVAINPKKILGRWRAGYALDVHSTSSIYLGVNAYGHDVWDTTHSEIGESLYLLKYKQDIKVLDDIVHAAVQFLKETPPPVDMLIPVPPSNEARKVQPVMLIAAGICTSLNLPLQNCIQKTHQTSAELKNTYGMDERLKLLEGLYKVERSLIEGKRILLFDDLYRSGATMNAIADLLYENGAIDVLALTITKNRKPN